MRLWSMVVIQPQKPAVLVGRLQERGFAGGRLTRRRSEGRRLEDSGH